MIMSPGKKECFINHNIKTHSRCLCFLSCVYPGCCVCQCACVCYYVAFIVSACLSLCVSACLSVCACVLLCYVHVKCGRMVSTVMFMIH